MRYGRQCDKSNDRRSEHQQHRGAGGKISEIGHATLDRDTSEREHQRYKRALPEKVNERPTQGLNRRHRFDGIHLAPPSSSSRSWRICASSFLEACLIERARTTSFRAEPPNARSIRSLTSCFCVSSSGNAAS